jgi:hypothetical protein
MGGTGSAWRSMSPSSTCQNRECGHALFLYSSIWCAHEGEDEGTRVGHSLSGGRILGAFLWWHFPVGDDDGGTLERQHDPGPNPQCRHLRTRTEKGGTACCVRPYAPRRSRCVHRQFARRLTTILPPMTLGGHRNPPHPSRRRPHRAAHRRRHHPAVSRPPPAHGRCGADRRSNTHAR